MKVNVYDSPAIADKLDEILRTDSQLKSFEIIPQPTFRKCSPVRHVDHHLGLESWCIGDLYGFVQKQLLSTETENQMNYLAIALLLNPNVKTYWNSRKRFILNGDLNVDAELDFVAVILKLKPKVQDLYNHRKWLLSTLLQHGNIRPDRFFKELNIIQNVATKHVNNHAAWNFATWLLAHVTSARVLQEVWRISREWTSINISDFSGIHFHQRVLIALIDASHRIADDFKLEIAFSSEKYLRNFSSRSEEVMKTDYIRMFFAINLISVDFESNDKLIHFYGHHESLWNHRRFLSYLLVKKVPQKVFEERIKQFLSLIDEPTPTLTNFLRLMNENFVKNPTEIFKMSVEKYDRWMEHLQIYPAD